MSQENVELVRRNVDAMARRDWQAVAGRCDPQVEWIEMPSLGPDPASYVGIDEMREAVENWFGMWDTYEHEIERIVEAEDDQVLVLTIERAGLGDSGASVERRLGQLCTVRDGKVVSVRLYGGWPEALEAAGLGD